MNDCIKEYISLGETEKAVELMLSWGIKQDLAVDIVNGGPEWILDDYPFDKERARSFIRYSPDYIEEE